MERLYRKIKEGRSSECLVLVPRRVSANKLRRDLIERLGFIFNLKIQTIPEYFKTLTFRNGSAPRQLPDAVAAEIIGQLAKLHNPGKQAFVNLLKRLSGQKLALNTLQSLILAGISSDDLATCQNANISSIHNLFRDYLNFCNANNIADRALWQMTIIEALEKEKSLPQAIQIYLYLILILSLPT